MLITLKHTETVGSFSIFNDSRAVADGLFLS